MDGKQILYFEHEDVALEEAALHGHANPGSAFEVVHLASEARASELLAKKLVDPDKERVLRLAQKVADTVGRYPAHADAIAALVEKLQKGRRK